MQRMEEIKIVSLNKIKIALLCNLFRRLMDYILIIKCNFKNQRTRKIFNVILLMI